MDGVVSRGRDGRAGQLLGRGTEGVAGPTRGHFRPALVQKLLLVLQTFRTHCEYFANKLFLKADAQSEYYVETEDEYSKDIL